MGVNPRINWVNPVDSGLRNRYWGAAWTCRKGFNNRDYEILGLIGDIVARI